MNLDFSGFNQNSPFIKCLHKLQSEQQELFIVNILIVFFEKKKIDKQEIELSS